MCYTCVRECPAKAIKIENGQARVTHERCIVCGNCVKVCSQEAKTYYNSIPEVTKLLDENKSVIACIAPSFPAEFDDVANHKKLVGMIRMLGFDQVVEVSFGADLVAREYNKILEHDDEKPCISSDCPAIVYYIEQYYPDLVKALAKIVSPMVAITRVLKHELGNNIKTVFIGPCLAKKAESDEVDAVLTFRELRELFRMKNISSESVEESDFDPPYSGRGAIFPISRGLLQTVNRTDDIAEGKILVAEGRVNFREIVKEFAENRLGMNHLELLCCEGCIMGPGMSKHGKRFARRTLISKYVKEKLKSYDARRNEEDIAKYSVVDLSQQFKVMDKRTPLPQQEEISRVLVGLGKKQKSDHLNCGACGYDTCEEHAIAIIEGLAEDEMCLPFTIEKLHSSINDLNQLNQNLAEAQQALKQSEKLASMGQLSAGIAHELNNPLGVITMYSNILKEEAGLQSPMSKDLSLIAEQAERCKNIVGGLLNFARKSQLNLSEVNISDFLKHSLESVIIPENVKVSISSTLANPFISIDPEQMMQVFTNLEKNAFEAMPGGGRLTIQLFDQAEQIVALFKDTGTGIKKENMDKIFTPFFTTKEIGKGTGLGLPLIYGIIKMHKGHITVKSNADIAAGETGTEFKIIIPRMLIEKKTTI